MHHNFKQVKSLPRMRDLAERSLSGERGSSVFTSSLRTTLMCWFLVISLVPVIIISLVGHNNAVSFRKEDISSRLKSVSMIEKLDLEKQFQNIQDHSSNAALSSKVKSFSILKDGEVNSLSVTQSAVDELKRLQRDVAARNVFIVDAENHLVLSSGPKVNDPHNWVEAHTAGSKLQKTISAVFAQNESAFTGFSKGHAYEKEPYAYHVEPIQTAAGSVVGCLLVKIGADSFILNSGRYDLVGRSVRFYALNENLDLLTTNSVKQSEITTVVTVITDNAVKWKNNLDFNLINSPQKQSVGNSELQVFQYEGLDGEEVLGVFQDLEILGTHVGLVTEIPKGNILGSLKGMDYTLVGLILIIGLVVAIAGIIVSSRLIAPINQLGQVMQRVSDGHEVWTLPNGGPQEVRRLTDMFHLMISKLSSAQEVNQHQFVLQSEQFNLNEKLRGQKSLDDVAEAALEYFVNYHSAQMGVFYLLERKNVLRVASSFGVEGGSNSISEIVLGQGLLGKVATDNKTQVLRGVSEASRSIESGLMKTQVNNLILAPIHLAGRVLGFLELGSISEVSDEDLDLLHLVSENIAVVINAERSRERVNRLLKETWNQTTALSKQQKELKESNNRLEQADHYKSEFLANMSHELRTPLNSLLIMSQVLAENRDCNLSHSEVEAALTINKAGSDLLLLINDILDLSRVEAGKLDMCFEKVEIKSLMNDMGDLFSPLATKQRVEFRAIRGPELPSEITSDPLRLTQILKNILNNAFKFTEQGSVIFRVRCAAPGELSEISGNTDSSWIVFSVADTGTGMNEKTLDLIFEAFNQGDGSTGRRYGGSGLGLSISRKLGDLLGGIIQVESLLGKGSTFRLFLPVTPSDDIQNNSMGHFPQDLPELAIPIVTQNDHQTSGQTKQKDDSFKPEKAESSNDQVPPIDLSDCQVLICDDDMRMVFKISEIVDNLGAEVTLAHSWEHSTRECLDGGEFDLAVVSSRLVDRPENGDIGQWKAASGGVSFPVLTLAKDGGDQGCCGADMVGSRPLAEGEFLNMVQTVLASSGESEIELFASPASVASQKEKQ